MPKKHKCLCNYGLEFTTTIKILLVNLRVYISSQILTVPILLPVQTPFQYGVFRRHCSGGTE